MVAFLRVTALTDRPKVSRPVRTVTGERCHVIHRNSGYTAHPASPAVVVPSRLDLVKGRHARGVQISCPSGKGHFASRLATSFRSNVSSYVSFKSLWVLSVEITHKTSAGSAAFFAAATIAHVAAICAVRHLAIAATFVSFLSGSRGVFSRIPSCSANHAFPVSPVFSISLQPEFRNRLRCFAGRANLQFWNCQDSLILH